MKIKEIDIEEEITVCPYCMEEPSIGRLANGCCGEDHFDLAYVLKNGDCVLVSESEIEKV